MRRREFIRISSYGLGGAALLGGVTTDWFHLYGSELPNPGTDGDRVVPTFCELCFWKCGVLAHVKDGRVTKLQGNPIDPLSRGHLCPRGTAGTGLLYDPDRLKTPLIRTDNRGTQEFREATWDEALDLIAEKLLGIKQEYGPEAVALYSHGYGGSWMTHLLKAWGSPNIAAPSYAQCRGPREVGFDLTFGQGVGSPERTDLRNSQCLVLIGSHLGENMHNTQVQDFAHALRNGADLIVLDPRYSVAASKATHWLPVKPGSDMAILLAWMNVLINEDLYDREYIENYAYGFDQLKQHVQQYTPEWAYPRTGIEPEVIRRTARMMGASKPATLVHPGRHVTWYGNDTQRSRAIAIVNALLGSWGRKGGFYIPSSVSIPAFPTPAYTDPGLSPADRPDPSLYPLADEALSQGICDASVPGVMGNPKIKAWMVYGSNLPASLPNPEATRKALESLDFVVAVDVLPTEITGWADVVLPEATYLERCDAPFAPSYREPYVTIRQEVVPPLYESKPGWWIAKELGIRLGLPSFFPWESAEHYTESRLKPLGIDCELIKKEGVVLGEQKPIYYEEGATPQFYTESGRIELFSQKLAANGFDPMPVYREDDVEDPPPGYYRLLFGRAPMHTFGRTTNNDLLLETGKENAVWVNTQVAASWGLKNGDRIHLRNQDNVTSEFTAPVKVTEGIRPDCVFVVHGFGHQSRKLSKAHGRGINDSELVTRVKVDPIMGGTGMNVNFVTFVRPSAVAADAESAAVAEEVAS